MHKGYDPSGSLVTHVYAVESPYVLTIRRCFTTEAYAAFRFILNAIRFPVMNQGLVALCAQSL